MKKILLLICVLTIPALLYLNVWQAFRYRTVETEIDLLTNTQQEWIEKNKNIIIGIEALGAPSRIYGLASEMESLDEGNSPGSIRIEMGSRNGGDNG